MKSRISRNVKGILTCGILGIIFWLFPEIFSLGLTPAEFYLQYRAVGMTLFGITILTGIDTLILIKKSE